MAQIRFSNLVNDIRGAVGGVTFSRSASGATVSARKSSRRARRSRASSSFSPLPSLAQSWRALSQAERDQWRNVANQVPAINRLGLPRTPSGFELFVEWSSSFQRMGFAGSPVPSVAITFPYVRQVLSALFLEASTNRIRVTLASSAGAVPLSFYLLVSTRSFRNSANTSVISYRFLGTRFAASGIGSGFNVTPNAVAPPSNYLVGQRVYFKLIWVEPTSGRVLAQQPFSGIITQA